MSKYPPVGSAWSFKGSNTRPTVFFECGTYEPAYDGIIVVLGLVDDAYSPPTRVLVLIANGRTGSIAGTWFAHGSPRLI